MPAIIRPHLISCDEAGFTGNDMLNPAQQHFSYASHDLYLEEAEQLVAEVRKAHPVQMPELKASKLLKTERGRGLIADVLDRMEGRYIATVYEKKLSLCCKLFEYIYEPVLQANNMLFYRNNLHRFVAMYFYMQVTTSTVGDLAVEFEAFMRTLDPGQAPTLFGAAAGPHPDPLVEQVLRFARGYADIIAEETRALERTGDSGKWVLDLTLTAVFSHLAAWGERHPLVEVVCDDSKPLRALSDAFEPMINRPEPVVLEVFGKRRPLTWNMSGPITFGSSANHAGIQLADLIAGVAAGSPGVGLESPIAPLAERVYRHLHEDCIMPDFDAIDLQGDEAPVNWLVLEHLAYRADGGFDPLLGMEEMYDYARQTLPDFRAGAFQELTDES